MTLRPLVGVVFLAGGLTASVCVHADDALSSIYSNFSNKNFHINHGFEVLPDGTKLQELDPNATQAGFESTLLNNIQVARQKAMSGRIQPRYRLFFPDGGQPVLPPSHDQVVKNAQLAKNRKGVSPINTGCDSTTDPGVCSYFETPASMACLYGAVSPAELAQEPGCSPGTAMFNPTGGGGAIAVVLAYDNPNATSDLNVFSNRFGLPAVTSANFQVVYASGEEPNFNSEWALESSLDTQWAHAMAPNAKIFLVESANNGESLYSAVQTAAKLVSENGGGIVSMSWGGGDIGGASSLDANFYPNAATPGVVFIAASGDLGVPQYPSTSPFVIAAGGTTVIRDANGNFIQEMAWTDGGGGFSESEPRPPFQNSVASLVGVSRGTPDISFNADPTSGVYIYNSSVYNPGQWLIIGGTSVASPSLAGILNSAFAMSGNLLSISDSYVLSFLYQNLANTSYVRDITLNSCSGSDNYNLALPGYDLCTGAGVLEGGGWLSDGLPVDGSCGSANQTQATIAPTSGLCSIGTPSKVTGSGPWAWSCAEKNGGQTDMCSTFKASSANGVCGYAYGENMSTAPVLNSQLAPNNLCQSGAASVVTGTGPWYWTCQGINGGTSSVQCFSSPLPMNGACGSAAAAQQPALPTIGLCSIGQASAVMNAYDGIGLPFIWYCEGLYGGTAQFCETYKYVNGACGSANGVGFSTAPTTNLCASGTATSVTGTGPWIWECLGANNGTSASCSARKLPVNGVCGSAAGVAVVTAPTANLCSTGTPSTVIGSGPWDWTCAGANGGRTSSCAAPVRVPVSGVCGSAAGVAITTAPKTNLCSTGAASAVIGSGPWDWTCAGANGGRTSSCLAPL